MSVVEAWNISTSSKQSNITTVPPGFNCKAGSLITFVIQIITQSRRLQTVKVFRELGFSLGQLDFCLSTVCSCGNMWADLRTGINQCKLTPSSFLLVNRSMFLSIYGYVTACSLYSTIDRRVPFFKKRKITAFTLSEVLTAKYCWLSDDLGPLSYFEV